MLIAGWTLSGIGSAGLMNGALSILSTAASLEKRPLYTALLMGVGQIGIICGPLVDGALTEHASWRWCFYLNLPVGACAALVVILVRINDANSKTPYTISLFRRIIPQLDLPGFAIFAPACVMFLIALQLGGVGFVLFTLLETKVGDEAMIPGALLRDGIMLASVGHTVALGTLVTTTSLWLPLYFQAVKGESPTVAGIHSLPSILSQLLFGLISGIGVSKLEFYLPCATGAGILAFLIFAQDLAGAIFNIVANTILTQTLIQKIPVYAPLVSMSAVLSAGASASAVESLVDGDEADL